MQLAQGTLIFGTEPRYFDLDHRFVTLILIESITSNFTLILAHSDSIFHLVRDFLTSRSGNLPRLLSKSIEISRWQLTLCKRPGGLARTSCVKVIIIIMTRCDRDRHATVITSTTSVIYHQSMAKDIARTRKPLFSVIDINFNFEFNNVNLTLFHQAPGTPIFSTFDWRVCTTCTVLGTGAIIIVMWAGLWMYSRLCI